MIKPSNRFHLPFWIFTLALACGLTLPILIQDGMFQDGVLYASVAKNLVNGFGSFWFPQYSTLNIAGIASFHEQPPLFFGIQALFYVIFGNSIYVERAFVFLMLLCNIYLIHRLWQIVFSASPVYAKYSWLPILIWILLPTTFWSFRHNMIENLMSVFSLLSVILIYKNLNSEKTNYLTWFLASASIFCASFCKGIPGFFTLTLPFIYWLINRKIGFKQVLIKTFLLASVSIVLYAAFIAHPISRESLSIYFFQRLLMRVSDMPTVGNRFQILIILLFDLVPILLIIFTVFIFSNKKKLSEHFKSHQILFYFFLFIGLAGVLPLMLTRVQKSWYMLPSYPYLAIAFALLLLAPLEQKINAQRFRSFWHKLFLPSSIALTLCVIFCIQLQFGKVSREQENVHDVYAIGKVVPRFSTLSIPLEMYDEYDFVLQGFLVRYFNISISPYQAYDFYLKEKSLNVAIPYGYKKVNLNLIKYDLYQKE